MIPTEMASVRSTGYRAPATGLQLGRRGGTARGSSDRAGRRYPSQGAQAGVRRALGRKRAGAQSKLVTGEAGPGAPPPPGWQSACTLSHTHTHTFQSVYLKNSERPFKRVPAQSDL